MLTQLFALPVAWSLWQSDRPAIAIPMAAVAVLALITVLSPPSTAWLITDHDEDGDTREDDDRGDQGAQEEAEPVRSPGEPRSLGQRLKDRLKEQPTKD
ncbi:hypothetical protein E1264_39280 [Actinomadura sp. KC216]|nr:hypothetical protein E1264_39280 [Actinomadura sp. KC216]